MITRRSIINFLLIPAILVVTAAACSDNGTGIDDNDINFEASAMLQNEANNVILQTYIDLDTEAGKLVSAVEQLKNSATKANLEVAQTQWKNTRKPWESSEGFLFGPVANEGIDPAIDSWPLNKTDLQSVLNSGDQLTKEYVDNLTNNLKGFHTIEFLLFGEGSNKTVSDFTAREFDYLVAATKSLKSETAKLVKAWKSSGGNYVGKIANAGSGNSVYPSKKSAIQELANGLEVIANEVAAGKIGGPLSEQDPSLVESQFSFNSKLDFQNNIRSIKHIYTGDYKNSSGLGLSDYIVKVNPDLDARFKNEIENAITTIGNIEGNFRDAITENPNSVEQAQEAVLTIRSTIRKDIKPLINEF